MHLEDGDLEQFAFDAIRGNTFCVPRYTEKFNLLYLLHQNHYLVYTGIGWKCPLTEPGEKTPRSSITERKFSMEIICRDFDCDKTYTRTFTYSPGHKYTFPLTVEQMEFLCRL